MTVSDMRMHHVFVILTLTFIQGKTYLNCESNKRWIISETVQAMPITFAVKVVRQMAYMTIASPMTLTFTQSPNSVSNMTSF